MGERVRNGVREARQRRGWTQAELGAAVEVSRQSINSIERGRYIPSLPLALRISRAFRCTVDELFELED